MPSVINKLKNYMLYETGFYLSVVNQNHIRCLPISNRGSKTKTFVNNVIA